jgi:short-subunit dehydrogenase
MLDLAGRTALVTGASAGIGREMARILARDVRTLVLVARRRERLDELASELVAANPSLRVEVKAVDLADRSATRSMLDELAAAGLAIDVVINNAGFGDYGLFDRSDWSKLEKMLELNVVGATFLLHALLPSMIERGFGAVLNVGSAAGMFPSPGAATYAASKAYLNHLTEALRGELAGTGVSVTALCPGPVPTEFREVAGSGPRPPVPEALRVEATDCAEAAIAALRAGKARVIPGPMRAAVVSIESVPRALVRPLLARMGRRIRG